MSNIRRVNVDVRFSVPGLDVKVPLSDTLILEDGYTDESDIPAIIAVNYLSGKAQAHMVTVDSVRPCLRKGWYNSRPSETTLAQRRGWRPFVDGESADASVWRAQHGGLLQRSNDPGCLWAVFANHIYGSYAR